MEAAFEDVGSFRALRVGRYLPIAACTCVFIMGCNAQPVERAPLGPTTNLPVDSAPLPPTRTAAPAPQDTAALRFPASDSQRGAELTYRIVPAPNGTYGYDIFSNGRLLVHQAHLPGVPGNEGCKTRGEAEKLAEFVIDKIRRGQMPPSVSPQDMKALGIH